MAMNDFARRMLGFDPLSMFSQMQPTQSPGGYATSGMPTNTATLAQPTLDQFYEEDLQRAQMGRVGNLGMMLLAASQNLTPAQRAAILAQAPQYMDGAEKDAMTAAQARLFDMSTRAKQKEMSRSEEIDKQAPAIANALGLSPELRQALTPEQMRELYIKKMTADPRESQLMDLKLQEEQAKIDALRAPKAGPAAQLVDLPGGGKAWATPGSSDIVPIGGAGKGGVDPENAKRSDAEEKNLTYAKEAISAHRVLSDPVYSGDLTSGYKKRVNAIPTIDGSWAGEKYLTGDSQANSFVDSVVRPRSGAVVGPNEMADKKRIFTPMPGDSQDLLLRKAQMRAQHIESLIAGANPADRPMLQQMYQESVKELERIYKDGQQPMRTDAPSRPGVRSITPIN